MTYFAALLRYPSSRLPYMYEYIIQYCDTCGLEEPFQLVSYDNWIPSPCISTL